MRKSLHLFPRAALKKSRDAQRDAPIGLLLAPLLLASICEDESENVQITRHPPDKIKNYFGPNENFYKNTQKHMPAAAVTTSKRGGEKKATR